MNEKLPLVSSLQNKVVALPESRQLDILADLFERRGAHVLRIPLVSILDNPDTDTVTQWLQGFIAVRPDYLILLTGEGLRRLLGFARRSDCYDQFVAELGQVSKLCRGPKPGRVLRELGMKPDYLGKAPTSEGIISTLDELSLSGQTVAVQLYGDEPNVRLIDYLQQREAIVSPVAPYIYAGDSDTERVQVFIYELIAGSVDVISFTSQPQFKRLLQVAREVDMEAQLFTALATTTVAAVGPVVRDQLHSHGVRVDVMPTDSFFMKPLVVAIERQFSTVASKADD